MRRQIILDAEARLEFENAVIWYNEQQPGTGDRFEAVSKKTRQARVEVFKKYSVYFRIEPDFVGIVSIFHGSRNPAELRRRLK